MAKDLKIPNGRSLATCTFLALQGPIEYKTAPEAHCRTDGRADGLAKASARPRILRHRAEQAEVLVARQICLVGYVSCGVRHLSLKS